MRLLDDLSQQPVISHSIFVPVPLGRTVGHARDGQGIHTLPELIGDLLLDVSKLSLVPLDLDLHGHSLLRYLFWAAWLNARFRSA